jgi:hypothetical protein
MSQTEDANLPVLGNLEHGSHLQSGTQEIAMLLPHPVDLRAVPHQGNANGGRTLTRFRLDGQDTQSPEQVQLVEVSVPLPLFAAILAPPACGFASDALP